ncbi:MAG: lipopolysaccharide heptosyltransferase II [Deltaproteobacteria bacterium]|nr:lipopolysaccharide heptosyltransferase II [Deltaproteobacteria bacterium]
MVIVQTAFVGDVVFSSPLVHAVKQAQPDCHVAMMVQPDKAEVAACIPGVDEVLPFDKRHRDSGPLGLLRAAKRLRQGRFDLLISPHRSARTALLARLSGIPTRIGYAGGMSALGFTHRIELRANEPCRIRQDLYLLEPVGMLSESYRLRLKAPAEGRAYRDAFFNSNALSEDARLVGLCIGSVWPTKRWPAVYFASLAEFLRARNYTPVLMGGPKERSIAREIEGVLGQTLLSCVGNRLSETAALLEHCDMVVGGDSGLTHMARALGVPTVIIFGPTDPKVHCFSEHTQVLIANVRCRPCSHHGQNRCPERHHDCMRLVSPEQVIAALRRIADIQTPVPARIEERQESLLGQAPATVV